MFQQSLVKAQVCLLAYVPANSRILIVGGWTGWILEELAKFHVNGLVIDYVESSAKMIMLSQKKKYKDNIVYFINTVIENYITDNNYDIVLTPFLFDNFLIDKVTMVFNKLDALLKTNGKWLHVDFIYDKKNNKIWQKILLKAMYFFFRITCHIEADELIDMDVFSKKIQSHFLKNGITVNLLNQQSMKENCFKIVLHN